MTTERSPRFPAFRIVVMLVVLVNLILTIAVITQVRELQQRVASLPPDLASKRDVAMLRPLAGSRDPHPELRGVSQHPASWGDRVDGAGGDPAHRRAHANPPGRQYLAR